MADNKTKKKTNKVVDKNNKVVNKNKVVKDQKENKTKVGTLASLTSKMKFFTILISILTFGIFWIYLKNKIKHQKEENKNDKAENPTLRISTKIPFNINELIKILGTEKNIKSVDASLNTLKIEFLDKSLIEEESIKKIGAKGLIFSSNKISIIFGDYAIALKDELIKILPLNKIQSISID